MLIKTHNSSSKSNQNRFTGTKWKLVNPWSHPVMQATALILKPQVKPKKQPLMRRNKYKKTF